MEGKQINGVKSCRHTAVWLAAALLVAPSFLGCGTAEYDARVTATLDSARQAEPFLRLWKEETELTAEHLNGLRLTLRLPKLLDKSRDSSAFDADSPDPRDETAPLDPYRRQPYFLELPGHVRTYERILSYVEQATGTSAKESSARTYRWPLYCIVAVYDASGDDSASDGDAKSFRKRIHQQLREEFGKRRTVAAKTVADRVNNLKLGVEPAWQALTLPTPAGRRTQWHRLRVTGDQYFHIYGSGEEASLAKPTKYRGEYYLFHRVFRDDEIVDGEIVGGGQTVADGDTDGDTDGGESEAAVRHVLLAFRAPVVLSLREQLATLGGAVAGTVRLHPPMAASADELSEDESSAKEDAEDADRQ